MRNDADQWVRGADTIAPGYPCWRATEKEAPGAGLSGLPGAGLRKCIWEVQVPRIGCRTTVNVSLPHSAPSRHHITFGRSGHRAAHWSPMLPARLFGQSAVISLSFRLAWGATRKRRNQHATQVPARNLAEGRCNSANSYHSATAFVCPLRQNISIRRQLQRSMAVPVMAPQ